MRFVQKHPSEATLERRCRQLAKKRGWLTYKFVSPGVVGVPDRIFIKGGLTFFIEFKTEIGRVSPSQKIQIERLKDVGANVAVVRKFEEFTELIRGL